MTGWDEAVLSEVQDLLDASLASAGPVQASFFGKPERRMDALTFLTTWNSVYMCAVATAGSTPWPHIAAVKLEFDAHARLEMLLYEGSVRRRDLEEAPRLALQKHRDDGTIMTCYARLGAPTSEPTTDARGRSSTRFRLDLTRMYGIGPYVSGPLAGRS